MDDEQVYLVESVLHGLTVDELKYICREHMLCGYSVPKAQIIDLIVGELGDDELLSLAGEMEKLIVEREFALVGEYLSGRNATRLTSIALHGDVVTAHFDGFSWDVNTKVVLSPGPDLGFSIDCSCKRSREGVLCSHFWTCLCFYFGKKMIEPSTWQKTSLPDGFEELAFSSGTFEGIGTGVDTQVPVGDDVTVEQYLREHFLGRGNYNEKKILKDTTANIREFMARVGVDDPNPVLKRPRKADLVDALRAALGTSLGGEYFTFKINQKMDMARDFLVDIEELRWDPLSCVAYISAEEDYTIIVNEGTVEHGGCHWGFHKPVFCDHLVALFIALDAVGRRATLSFLSTLLR